ncbi:MAG: ParB N-terminal domain-containing protein [Methanomicrobia archaeon]|nr:ParB N-terminal domain-containing protein [Methanomicrobia archaeon]
MGVEKAKLEEKPVRIMKIHFIDIDLLKPHEALDPLELELFVKSINEKGVFYKPMLVDKTSFVILDGHHRWIALKKMGAKKIPCILLDYFNSEIKLYTWYPVLSEKLEKILEFFDHYTLEGYENHLGDYSFIITDGKKYYGLKDKKSIIKYIEKKGYNFEYVDTIEAALKETKNGKTAFLRRTTTKEEVIEKASKNEVFSPKTTRHWFPYKYPYLYIKKEELIS